MPKLLQFDQEARRSLAYGVHILARAVRGTLGPKGRLVVLDRPIGKPVVSNDGISIANEIELPDRFENMGVQLIREAAFQTNEMAGDGTTTSTILADALIQHAQNALDQGVNPVDLTAQLDIWGNQALEMILSQRFALDDSSSLEAVAKIAAGNTTLGHLVAEALERLGADGHIEIETDFGQDRVLFEGGMQFDRGFISHHLVTDPRSMVIEMDDAALLITDQKIDRPGVLDELVDQASQRGHSILIIAEDFDPAITSHIVSLNERTPYPVAAIRAPEFGPWRKMALEDLAIFTAARFLARDLSLSPDAATWDDLGFASHIRITQDHTAITDGHGSLELIAGRKDAIRDQLAHTEQLFEKDKLSERLTRLAGDTATLYVSGLNTVEQKERAQRAEDAINAAKSALKEGVVLGGGVSYVHAAMALRNVTEHRNTESQRLARDILCQALEEPLRALAENSGVSPDEALEHISLSSSLGLNALNGQYENLRESRILDSVTSVVQALSNALAVAKMVINTTVLVTDTLDAVDSTEGPARGGGGEKLGLT
jgi:chaperonin GroEL